LVQFFVNTTGVEIPWKMHGRDIRPLLDNPETEEWQSPMVFTHTARSYGSDTDDIPTDERLMSTGNTPWYVMLRDGHHKYVRTLVAGEVEEIYDLDADPEELTNLAARPENAALLEKLRATTIAELIRTEAQFVDRMPPTKAMAATR
ncbi:MAG: sulfatase, partial [Planctomycetales bacterium]|nr:sulfatase [Planctomycetales bacterium]